MLARIKFFTFLFVLNCPSSLLVPLAKQDGVTATNANNLVVKTNQIKESPNKSKVTEVIQQIDVKDNENKVISNVNQVIVTDEGDEMVPSTVQNDDKGIVHNEANSLNISLPLLSTKSVNGSSGNNKVDNATVPDLQNRLANETRRNVLNTTKNIKNNTSNNIEIKEVSTVPNGNTSNVNVNSTLKRNNKLTPVDNEGSGRNSTSLNNSTTSNLKNSSTNLVNETTAAHTPEHINGKKITSNDDNSEISWRSDVPKKRRNKNKTAKLDSESTSRGKSNFNANNGNGSVNNNIPVDNILKRNGSNEDQKPNKNDEDKDRSRKYLNDSTTIKTETLKHSYDESYPIIDMKFRRTGNQNQVNNVDEEKHNSTAPIDNNQSNSTPKYEAIDNATQSKGKVDENPVPDKDISSAEAPQFRSLIPNKRRKLQQGSTVAFREPKTNKSNKSPLKRMPEVPPIFNLNPLTNVLSGAFDFMKRFKRNPEIEAKTNLPRNINCVSKQMDDQTVISCKNTNKIILPTRKSLDDNSPNAKLYDTVDLECPLSVIVKLYAQQIFDQLPKIIPEDGIVNKIVNSFINGDENEVDLASLELYNVPIPVTLKLQIGHGKTKDFMEQLNSIVDATLCSLG